MFYVCVPVFEFEYYPYIMLVRMHVIDQYCGKKNVNTN